MQQTVDSDKNTLVPYLLAVAEKYSAFQHSILWYWYAAGAFTALYADIIEER